MPSPFDITAPSNVVVLDNKREGVAVFTVKNLTRRRVHATARVVIEAPNSESWATFQPPDGVSTDHPEVRDIAIDGNTTFEVKLTVPADVAPGSYKMKLIVSDEINPDDNFTESPEAQFTVPEPVKEERKLPPWLIPAIIIAVLVIVAIVVGVVVASNPSPTATPTPSETPTATATTMPTATPTPTPVPNPFVGSWLPVTANSGNLVALSIAASDSSHVTVTYTVPCIAHFPFLCLAGSTTSNSIKDVPFGSTQLSAADDDIALLIGVANDGQLVVASTLNSSDSNQVLRRRRRGDVVLVDAPIRVAENLNLPSATMDRLSNMLNTRSSP